MLSEEMLRACRVLPVITVRDVASSLALAQALHAGGMTALEITLRTPAALDGLREIKAALPDMLIAAGTVTNATALEQAEVAGADFCVSPGSTPALLAAAKDRGVPLLPGVSSASGVMLGMEYGLHFFKLFPAVAAGGMALLHSLAGPFPDARFCPTGGLGADNFRDFLALPNVVCCGGSWMVSAELVDGGRWGDIERLARDAMATND